MNTMNLADTPGYYYAIAYWLSALLIVMQNKKRIKSRGWWGVQLCFLIAITVLMTVTAQGSRKLPADKCPRTVISGYCRRKIRTRIDLKEQYKNA